VGFAAVEGEIVEVQPSCFKSSERSLAQFSATAPIEAAVAERSVLLGVTDASMAVTLSEAIRAEGIRTNFFSAIDEARNLIAKDRPSLVILEHDKTRVDGMAICRSIQQFKDDETPVVMVAAQEDPQAAASGVSD
jgi:DNA-binding NtrC family response regulator